MSDDAILTFASVLVLLSLMTVYFIPAVVGRKKRNATAIFVLDLFLGWTFVGWVIALVWAVMKESNVPSEVGPQAAGGSNKPASVEPAAHPRQHSFSYFYSMDGKDSGPHTLGEMLEFRRRGALSSDTLVIRYGDSEWRTLSEFPEFKES